MAPSDRYAGLLLSLTTDVYCAVEPTAIDHDDRSGHEASVVRDEESDDVGHFAGLALAAQRHHHVDERDQGIASTGTIGQQTMNGVWIQPGRDHVDASTASLVVDRHLPGEHHHAPLLAQYAAMPASPTTPAVDAMCTIAPPPFASITGTTWRDARNGPVRLVAMVRSESSRDASVTDPGARMPRR